MKKYFLFIAAAVIVVSCHPKKEEPKLKLDNFVYASYAWNLKEINGEYRWVFTLPFCIQIDKNGTAKIAMQPKWRNDSIYYYETVLSDSIINRINSLFADTVYKEEYSPGAGALYCGYPNYIEYWDKNTGKRTIGFAFGTLPDSLNTFIDYIQGAFNLNYKNDTANFKLIPVIPAYIKSVKPYPMNEIMEQIKAYSLRRNPLPSLPKAAPPPEIDMKKFTVPKVVH